MNKQKVIFDKISKKNIKPSKKVLDILSKGGKEKKEDDKK